jgi:hypothetical protein
LGTRYWNGQEWTEHIQAPTPLTATPAVAPSTPKERAGLGIAALCLGIGAVVTGAGMNVLFWLAWGLGGAALVTGAIARKGTRRKMAIWGLVLGVIGIACGVYGFVEVQKAVHALQQASSY